MSKERLIEILMEDDIVCSINNNLDELTIIIPEIKDMIGFEHNHPHHHLDVFNHTLLSLSRAPKDLMIRIVLLLHDIGKPHSYQDEEIRHFKNHPIVSSEISRKILERLNFSNEEIENICYLIKEHDSMIIEDVINNNKEVALKLFQIQFCDGLAHNPLKLEKRINYLLKVNEKVNYGKEKEIYKQYLLGMLNKGVKK